MSIWIDAPPDEVFAFIADIDSMAEFHPALVEITSMERLPNGGTTGGYRQRGRGGRLLDTTWEQVVFEPPRRLVIEAVIEDGSRTRSERDLEPNKGGTLLKILTRFDLGHGRLGWLVERMWRGELRTQLEDMLLAAKERLEARPRREAARAGTPATARRRQSVRPGPAGTPPPAR